MLVDSVSTTALETEHLALPNSQSIRNRIQEIYACGYVVGDDDVKHPIAPTSVASWRGEFLKSLYLAERATSSVEVGMAWGLSTMQMIEALLANGARPRAHVVIDPMQSTRYHNAARRLLIEAGVEDLVEFYEDRSDLILPKLAGEGRQSDFAFIDGDHNFEAVFLDAVFVDRILKPGGVVVLDDTWSHPVLMTCNFLEAYYDYTPVAHQLKPPDVRGVAEMAKHRRRHNLALGAALPKIRSYRKPLKREPRQDRDDELAFSRFALTEAYLPAPIAQAHARMLAYHGLLELSEGNRAEARQALALALRLHPTRLKNYARYIRTLMPSWIGRRLSGHTGRGEKNLANPAPGE